MAEFSTQYIFTSISRAFPNTITTVREAIFYEETFFFSFCGWKKQNFVKNSELAPVSRNKTRESLLKVLTSWNLCTSPNSNLIFKLTINSENYRWKILDMDSRKQRFPTEHFWPITLIDFQCKFIEPRKPGSKLAAETDTGRKIHKTHYWELV